VMIYLLALSGLSGAVNLIADGIFLVCTLISLWQVGCRVSLRMAVQPAACTPALRKRFGG
jgi:hypothetical protein